VSRKRPITQSYYIHEIVEIGRRKEEIIERGNKTKERHLSSSIVLYDHEFCLKI
jgi:hypothetical protein